MVYLIIWCRGCRYRKNSFACGGGNFLCIYFLSGKNISIPFFVIVYSSSQNNDRIVRICIFSNTNTWDKVLYFLPALDSCWICFIIIWYRSWYYSHWVNLENIIELNNLHAPMVTVLFWVRYHVLSSLVCFSVGRITHMLNRKQFIVHVLWCAVAPPNILLWCFESTFVTNHATYRSWHLNFIATLRYGNICHKKMENSFNGGGCSHTPIGTSVLSSW